MQRPLLPLWLFALGCGNGPGTNGSPDAASSEQSVCDRWRAVLEAQLPSSFNGNVLLCMPGRLLPVARDAALLELNFHRDLAGLPPLVIDGAVEEKTQACALMMDAAGSLSHTPDSSWPCFTAGGAEAASRSNIGLAPLGHAVGGFLIDIGNPTTLGHRRWFLSRWIDRIAFGSTSGATCAWVVTAPKGSSGWVAWPPPGRFPIEAYRNLQIGDLDQTGWSVQSDSADLAGATVTVTEGEHPLALKVAPLDPGYGSGSALSFIPDGWTGEAGKAYQVRVEGIRPVIEYQVVLVDCGTR